MLIHLDTAAVEVETDDGELLGCLKWMMPECPPGDKPKIRVTAKFQAAATPDLTGAIVRRTKSTVYALTADRAHCVAHTPGIGTSTINLTRCTVAAQQLIPAAQAPRSVVRSVLLDPLWFLLPPFGATVVHAALLATTPGHTILILGPSGAGKTTLCLLAATSKEGSFRLLADDTCLLSHLHGRVLARPVRTGIGITADSPFAAAAKEWETWFRSKGKLYLKSFPREGRGGGPVAAVLILAPSAPSRHSQPIIRRLERGAALKAILAIQTVAPTPYIAQHYAIWHRVATSCPTFTTESRSWLDSSTLLHALGECCSVNSRPDYNHPA